MAILLPLSILISCNQEVIQEVGGYGYIGVSLDQDISEDAVTKAGSDDMVFALDVLSSSGKVVETRDNHREVTAENPIMLQIGNYTVKARNGENLNAAFDSPYYEGISSSFRIKPNTTQTVKITCSLKNTVFSVEFPDDFSQFSDYEVAVTNGEGDKLIFSNKPDSGNRLEAGLDAKAYFKVTGTLTWELYLKNTDGGEYRATETYSNVKEKQHYHLKFEMGEEEEEAGGGAFAIRVKLEKSWSDSSHDTVLDFYSKNMPEVEANDGFTAESGIPYSVILGETSQKTLYFSVKEGLRSLYVIHDNDILEEKGLPKTVDLVGASNELLSTLRSAGFVVDSGATKAVDSNTRNLSIDITSLVSTLPSGIFGIDFKLIDAKGRYQAFDLVLEVIADIDAEASGVYAGWAAFAKLEGRIFNADKKDVVTFQYKKAGDAEWMELSPSKMDVNISTLRFSTILTGLQPSTEYVFRAVSDEDKETKEIRFTTAAAALLHNLSFDDWYKDGKAWMPNKNADNYIWDTANPGTASLGYVPTTPEESDVVKGKAARLETQLANVLGIKKLAAGNIYTGKFGKVAGVGAELNWGVPFTSRPLALRGYWKYAPKVIDTADSPYADKKGQTDVCQVQIFLTDWSAPFLISTSKKQFVDYNSSAIIARGEITTSDAHSGYVKFTIPLVYRDHRTPTHIVISGAASKYGDYFTGAVGSVLKLDEFELIYDPAELTTSEYNAVFSQVSPF